MSNLFVRKATGLVRSWSVYGRVYLRVLFHQPDHAGVVQF